MQFTNVTADAKANIYFDGKVVSHSITLESGENKTLGLIYEGSYHFGTKKAEIMQITDGTCAVTLDDSDEAKSYQSGEQFQVPANSGFTIEVPTGICQYVCSFLD